MAGVPSTEIDSIYQRVLEKVGIRDGFSPLGLSNEQSRYFAAAATDPFANSKFIPPTTLNTTPAKNLAEMVSIAAERSYADKMREDFLKTQALSTTLGRSFEPPKYFSIPVAGDSGSKQVPLRLDNLIVGYEKEVSLHKGDVLKLNELVAQQADTVDKLEREVAKYRDRCRQQETELALMDERIKAMQQEHRRASENLWEERNKADNDMKVIKDSLNEQRTRTVKESERIANSWADEVRRLKKEAEDVIEGLRRELRVADEARVRAEDEARRAREGLKRNTGDIEERLRAMTLQCQEDSYRQYQLKLSATLAESAQREIDMRALQFRVKELEGEVSRKDVLLKEMEVHLGKEQAGRGERERLIAMAKGDVESYKGRADSLLKEKEASLILTRQEAQANRLAAEEIDRKWRLKWEEQCRLNERENKEKEGLIKLYLQRIGELEVLLGERNAVPNPTSVPQNIKKWEKTVSIDPPRVEDHFMAMHRPRDGIDRRVDPLTGLPTYVHSMP